jgi:hypothetical protein
MSQPPDHDPERPPHKTLSPAARRALEEADARRKAAEAARTAAPVEIDGPKGAEPTRYGDWERKGIASDF